VFRIIEVQYGKPAFRDSAGPQSAPFAYYTNNDQHQTEGYDERQDHEDDDIRIGSGMLREHLYDRKKDHESYIEEEDDRS
jgi:hypothetical protein